MAELPKSVREQLARAQVRPDSHPDPDLLTAYSENSLTPAERKQVMEHIASCADCREVLFLAQPEPEQPSMVVTALPSRKFGWVAWASAAAVIVFVGSAVILQREKIRTVEPPKEIATTSRSADEQTREIVQAEHAPAASDRDINPKMQVPSRSGEHMVIMNAPRAPLPSNIPSAKEASAEQKKAKDETSQVAGLVANEPQQNAPALAGRVSSGPANAQNANVANVYTAQNTFPAAAPAMEAAKQRADVSRSTAAASSAFGYSQGAAARRELGRAHWRISKAGAVERSYLTDDWTPVLVGPGISFRVISVIGDSVWAGGTKGALFLSSDGGANWTAVKIDTASDIVSIHFDDAVNGTIRTSDGKAWKSSDGGKTWVLQ